MRLLLLLSILILALMASAAGAAAPVADAGEDIVEECASPTGASVTLDGTGSFDPDGDPLNYLWTSDGLGAATGVMPTVELPLGVHVVTLTVSAGSEMSTDEVTVTIEDSTPPELVLGGAPVQLWPPKHEYFRVSIEAFVHSASDGCDADLFDRDVTIVSVSSDEPENGAGDGNTLEDMVLVEDCRAVDLRAERQGGGNGRVYNATVELTDGSGNTSREELTIAEVPKSKGQDKQAQDSGAVFVVDGPCLPTLDLCPLQPADDCDQGFGDNVASLRMREHPRKRFRQRLDWRLQGLDSDAADFGDPTDDTHYQLCLWEEQSGEFELESEPGARAGDGWQAKSQGFGFRRGRKDRGDGIDRVELKAEGGANGSVRVLASGQLVDLPDLPVPDDVDLHVQLHNSAGHCWSSTFHDPRRNSEHVYKAVGE